jgi:succinate-semialdehyde dehydrogenase/glutarate-semialdehyde dehydrogenase
MRGLLAIKQPIGVCGAITPWNFPCSMITRKVSPALAAGCTVVLKPANETPLTALALGRARRERPACPRACSISSPAIRRRSARSCASIPPCASSASPAPPKSARFLYQQASVGVKKLGLELGGNAPFVVFDDADIDAAGRRRHRLEVPQHGPDLRLRQPHLRQDKIYDEFVEKLSKKVSAMKIGDGTEAGVVQGPLINMDAVDKVEKHIADAVKGGAKIVTGGKRHALGGSFFEPTVLSNVEADALVAHEGNLRPARAGVPLQGRGRRDRDVQQLAVRSGLVFLFARSRPRLARRRSAGIRHGRRQHRPDHDGGRPFGGVKESGLGREGSHHGMEEYVEIKYVMMAGV